MILQLSKWIRLLEGEDGIGGGVVNYCKLIVKILAVHNILQNVMKTHLLRSFNIIED